MRVTVEFHEGKPGASVKSFQMRSALARMVQRMAHSIEKVLFIFAATALLVIRGVLQRDNDWTAQKDARLVRILSPASVVLVSEIAKKGVAMAKVKGSGTKDSPWVLETPPGTAQYEAYRDEVADPPALIVQVGKTQLRYHLRCIEDLHASMA
jgi:hypothetical protein